MGRIFRWAVVLVILVILTSGSVAFYTIFFGGKDLVIPPLREMSVLDAVDEAERIGLAVKIEQVESSIPAGTVLAQWPEPGTKVRRDKNIIIKISRGGNKKAVPDLRGMETAQALKKIQELGFTAGDLVKINDDSRAAGTVIAQNPAVPAVVDSEGKVDLLVSLGPVPRDGKIPVPDIAQRSEADGKELIVQSGLSFGGVEYVPTPNTPAGMVMSTKPKAGTMVRLGDQVKLVVASGQKKPDPQVTAPGSAEAPQGTVTVEQPPAQAVQVGPAGPVKTVVTPRDPEIAGALGLPSSSSSQQPEPQQQPQQLPQQLPPGKAATGTAKIRYQVPPITKPMGLKIEMVDAAGTRSLLARDVKGGEYITLDAPFVKESVVTIYLGGEFVWQERYK